MKCPFIKRVVIGCFCETQLIDDHQNEDIKGKEGTAHKKDENLSVQLCAQWWGKCFGNFLLQSSENCCHMSGVAVRLGHLGKVILFDPFASYIFLISQFNLGNSWGEKTHVCRNYSCLPEYQMIRLRNWKTVDALNFVQGHMLSVAVRIFADLPPLKSSLVQSVLLEGYADYLIYWIFHFNVLASDLSSAIPGCISSGRHQTRAQMTAHALIRCYFCCGSQFFLFTMMLIAQVGTPLDSPPERVQKSQDVTAEHSRRCNFKAWSC